jgi:TIR domain
MVFVSYAHADRKRVEPLVKVLASHFNVWWDSGIELGQTWRRTLMDQLDSARCVVVVWTAASVEREFIWSEVERVKDRGILVPVKLDRNARIPLGFDQLQYLDLTSWTGRATKTLQGLVDRVGRLLARPFRERRIPSTLASDTWAVDNSLRATGELLRLSDEIRTIGGILIPGSGPVEDLLGTLEEVHQTYASVSAAISRFVAPAARKGRIDVKPYLAMERGALVTAIENNRGHCTRIVEYYARVGGLRDWLEPRLEPEKLKVLDETFGQLGTADGDLFAALARIGDVMTEEASAIVGLLLSGQQQFARKRVLEGRKKLLPLESSLSSAMAKLQQLESSLGYVSRAIKRKMSLAK